MTSTTHSKNLLRIALLLGWLAWFGTLVAAPPALASGYTKHLPVFGAAAAALFAVPVAVKKLIDVFRVNPKAAWLTIGLSVLTVLLFLVPFVVWAQDGIPYYGTAAVYAGMLAVMTCFAWQRYLRRHVIATPKNVTTA